MSAIEAELKTTKRINPERIALLAKQNRDTMMAMSEHELQSYIHQCEVDHRRLFDAANNMLAAGRLIADNMVTAGSVAIERGVSIR